MEYKVDDMVETTTEAPKYDRPRRRIKGWKNTCQRCGYSWDTPGEEMPKCCSRCKAPNWNKPRKWIHPHYSQVRAKKRKRK